MHYDIINQSNCSVLKIKEDRFDAKLAPSFREEVEEVIKASQGSLILDIEQVKFMDSSGLGAVMGVYKLLQGRKLIMVQPQRAVQELLKLTRMDKLITSFDSVDEAIERME